MEKFLGTLLLCSWLIRLLVPAFLVTTIYPHDLLETYTSHSEESQNFAYHSNVSEVRLVFFVTDENSRHVDGLRSVDFAVVDNGWVIRNFRSFTRSGLVKLDVIVLIDSSESILPRSHERFPMSSNQLIPLAEIIDIRLHKNELAVRVDDAKHESKFVIKEMIVRPERDRIQRHINEQMKAAEIREAER